MDWINKTSINKTWRDKKRINKIWGGITRIFDQVRKGFFFLGFIGTVMFQ